MTAINVLKGSCTAVGAVALVATVVVIAVHVVASLEVPRVVR